MRRCVGLHHGLLGLGGSFFVLGCTALNPLYADSAGGETKGASSSTSSESGGPTSTDSGKTTSQVTSTEDSAEDSSGHTSPSDTEVDPDTTGETASTTDPDPTTCSTYVQDCPKGDEKCMPWSDNGVSTWNALGCFPLDPNPATVGDVCTVDGSLFSGIDDCDETSMCWGVDADSNQGICAAFCQGSEGSPVCDDPSTRCLQGVGVVAVCVHRCDPLLEDCPTGEVCAPNADEFVCVPDDSNMPQNGQPCESLSECGSGSVCLPSAVLVGCGASRCCTTFCDLSDDDLCPQEAVCVPWYPKGTAPAGLENVGICGSSP